MNTNVSALAHRQRSSAEEHGATSGRKRAAAAPCRRRCSALRSRAAKVVLIPEFAAAVVILICGFILPVAHFSVVPLRYVIAHGIVGYMNHMAALAETRTLASSLQNQSGLVSLANKCGIELRNVQLSITCISESAGVHKVSGNTPIPAEWLPNGANAPCSYLLELDGTAVIFPLFANRNSIAISQNESGFPNYNQPVPLGVKASCSWENLGCDPSTKEFYINE